MSLFLFSTGFVGFKDVSLAQFHRFLAVGQLTLILLRT